MSFAIITFRATGPIKTWADLRAAQVHNLREKPIDHAVEGGQPPFVILGSNDLVGDVKKKLVQHGIDPNNLRGNGVLAYEAVMTASPAFFAQWAEEKRDKRLFEWVAAQMSFALDRYGKRVASMVLHRDEETPHVHAVIVPLQLVDDQRRKDRGWRWSLVGSSISGPGRFDQLQDAYAEAMAPFGLVRGERGGGHKNEPYRAMMARVADREKAATDREVMALNTIDASEQQRRIWLELAAANAEQADTLDRKLADAEAKAVDNERRRKELDEEAKIIAEKAAKVESAQLAVMSGRSDVLRAWNEINQQQAELDDEEDRQATIGASFAESVKRAEAFAMSMASIDRSALPPSVATALRSAESLIDAPRLVSVDRYEGTASPRTVPLPIWRQESDMGA